MTQRICKCCPDTDNQDWLLSAIRGQEQLIKNRQEDIDLAVKLIGDYRKRLEDIQNAAKTEDS